MMMASFDLHQDPSGRLKPSDDLSAVHDPYSYIPSILARAFSMAVKNIWE
jgi:hypothetical protein